MDKRINSIDILRGVAIILMIDGHIYQFWTYRFHNTFGAINYFIYLIAPALFILVAGIGNYIFIKRRINRNLSKRNIFTESLKRALFLFFITTSIQLIFASFLNMQATMTFFILYWSIFQLMAFSMILFLFIPFLKTEIRIVIYPCLFILIFLITHLIYFYQIEILYILIKGGSFPLLPWANFFIFGMAFGDLLVNKPEDQNYKILYIIFSIGLTIFIYYFIWLIVIQSISSELILQTALNILLDLYLKAISIFLILFSLFYYISDIKEKDTLIQRKIVKWGQLSFSIYYIHWVIIAAGLTFFPLLINSWSQYRFSMIEYIIIVILFFVVLEIILIIWEKFGYKLGLEWFMKKLMKKPSDFK